MDQPQYSTVMQVLSTIPDPRKARGKQLEWPFILGVIASALLSHQRSIAAMAQWATHHATALVAAFQPVRGRVPSEATLRRAVRQVDVTQLEYRLAHLSVPPPPRLPPAAPATLAGYAMDGKYLRGARAHGCPTVLVSLVQHQPCQVLAQTQVPTKQHECVGVRQLLKGQDLTGKVITLDAGLTHPALATQILDQGGDYLMVVKRNQSRLHQELTWYFDTPPLACDRPWQTTETITKGDGRLEARRLACTDDLAGYLQWPACNKSCGGPANGRC